MTTGAAVNRPSARENETIRVNVSLLDKLMDLAGELVLSRNQLLRSLADTAEPGDQERSCRIST